jgi:hypothetical protein
MHFIVLLAVCSCHPAPPLFHVPLNGLTRTKKVGNANTHASVRKSARRFSRAAGLSKDDHCFDYENENWSYFKIGVTLP